MTDDQWRFGACSEGTLSRTIRIKRSKVSEHKRIVRLSLLTEPLMKRNMGTKALKAAAPAASVFCPGKTSKAIR